MLKIPDLKHYRFNEVCIHKTLANRISDTITFLPHNLKITDIIRNQGGDVYKECVRDLFKAHLAAENKEFLETMKSMRGSG